MSIHLENFNHYATGQYIDDKKALCITIEDISLDMTTDITTDGITQKITKEKIDKCILYGYRRAYELFEKGAKELSNLFSYVAAFDTAIFLSYCLDNFSFSCSKSDE